MNNKPLRKRKLNISLIALILAAAIFLGAWYFYDTRLEAALPHNYLAVHFIDVGQGDATLIAAQGQFMLIDGGERGNERRVINYLRSAGVERLDIVVASHPHSDHIGGLAMGILDAFPVGVVIAPRLSAPHPTRTYEHFLEAVSRAVEQGTQARYAQPGDVFALGDAQVTILGPLTEDPRNLNNNSVIVRLDYGYTSAMFTGDAERRAEAALAAAYGPALRVCVLKAGHHGSNTSSTDIFLYYTAPQFIVISCAAGNRHNHPDPRAMERIRATGATIYRTDIERDVVMLSDGVTFWRAD